MPKRSSYASKYHRRMLRKCLHSPSSQLCRRHVFNSNSKIFVGRGKKRKSISPHHEGLTKEGLRMNTKGRIVSLKRSERAKNLYYTNGALKEWTDAIKEMKHRQNNASYIPYEDDEDELYAPFQERDEENDAAKKIQSTLRNLHKRRNAARKIQKSLRRSPRFLEKRKHRSGQEYIRN